MFRSNAIYNSFAFDSFMTIKSTIIKTCFLLTLLLGTATCISTYFPMLSMNIELLICLVLVGGIIIIITNFYPKFSIVSAPSISIIQGILVGSISLRYALISWDFIFTAVVGTCAILFSVSFLYITKIIKVGHKLISIISTLTSGVLIFYMLIWILKLFGVSLPYLHETNPLTLVFSLVIVLVATLTLLADFRYIEYMAEHNLAKHMEWYAALSLLVTIVWLYVELLRLSRIVYLILIGRQH
ncbi:Bax inhibitor-1/YccA family membrane protein [Bacillus cereus]|uniref:Bax inhibitor-1/YccA family membrane protein n=1 Tax=Bacillus cereus TaxID=1396 RepID=UPI00053436BB|nr:Bax inhibitor-1/YccA family protein [Bacillus cereus]